MDWTATLKAIGFVLATSVLCTTTQAEIMTGRVLTVIDGDTVRLIDHNKKQHKIRLEGIDAPERNQAFGNVCRNLLYDIVRDREVDVIWYKTDKFGRILGTLVVDGGNVNLRMLLDGCAWYYKYYEKDLPANVRRVYESAQEQATFDQRNLWRDKNPIPPWEFRRNH